MSKIARNLLLLYGPTFYALIGRLLFGSQHQAGRFLRIFWTTQDYYELHPAQPSLKTRWLTCIAMLVQYALGVALIITGFTTKYGDAFVSFGAALIVIFPLLWVHLFALALGLRRLPHSSRGLKNAGRSLVCGILEAQVRRLRRKNDLKVVAVVGSIGKTSTKLAIAQVLKSSAKVVFQTGNYNDRVTVPLVLFEQPLPALWNAFAWTVVFIRNELKLLKKYPYQYAVLELGVDHPGEMQQFAYIQPDLLVVTALTEEHIEQFGSLEAAAREELVSAGFSKRVLVNADDSPAAFLKHLEYVSYGLNKSLVFYASTKPAERLEGQHGTFNLAGHTIAAKIPLLGEQGLKIALGAAAAADMVGLSLEQITKGLTVLHPVSGRMQVLAGIKDSILIDDTYNSSPAAVKAALDVVYGAKAKQRIAILGSMNELGGFSKEAHRFVGEYCDPKKLDLVVTIGQEAEKYLAPVAIKAGCRVESFLSPADAGKFVAEQLVHGAVVLAKGSQNRVFAEEALKPLLKNHTDAAKLVRQSAYWMNIKRQQFGI